jgi:hypothetical protein
VFGNANFGHLDQHGDAPELAQVVGTSAQRGNGLVGPVPTVTLVDEGPRPSRPGGGEAEPSVKPTRERDVITLISRVASSRAAAC